jgi:Tfp pilus assembly pilus retraction ATPase PilT
MSSSAARRRSGRRIIRRYGNWGIFMPKYLMLDLLGLVATKKAEELHLDFGVPPSIKVKGELHMIEGPPINPENIETLLQEIATDAQIQDIKNCGNLKFIIPFGYEHRFRADVTTRGDNFTLRLYNLAQK